MKTTNRMGLLFGLFVMGCALTAASLEQVNTTSPQTLTNKTLTAPIITDPTITGTTSIGAGATLTSPTLITPVLSGTATGTYTLAGTPTITAPAISAPTFSGGGTLAGSYIGTYTLGGTPTITAPSMSSPVLSGTATGTYTLAGTPTITAPAISSPVLSGTATGTYTLAGIPTVSVNLPITTSADPKLILNTTSGTTRRSFIDFQLSGTSKWMIETDPGAGNLQEFSIFDAEAGLSRLYISSTGLVQINQGLSVLGGQIAFPATQAPSADANTLDDYEEGTWVPSVGGTATYTVQSGTYTKIGRQVTAICNLTINAIGSGSTSVISGLPFTVLNTSTAAVFWSSGAVAPVYVTAVAAASGTTITLNGITAANASLSAIALMGNATVISVTLVYFTT